MSPVERALRCVSILIAVNGVLTSVALAQAPGVEPKHYAWSYMSLLPDARADLVMKELTVDEKISLLHGNGLDFFSNNPSESNGGAGYTVSIPRLCIPVIQKGG